MVDLANQVELGSEEAVEVWEDLEVEISHHHLAVLVEEEEEEEDLAAPRLEEAVTRAVLVEDLAVLEGVEEE